MNKLCGIELCRFMCAMAILFWHYSHFFMYGFWGDAVIIKTTYPLYNIFALLYNHGKVGVQVFWAISGFIFFSKYGLQIYDTSITAQKFAVRRFSRLYPLHFVTLIFVAVAQYIYITTHHKPFVFADNDFHYFLLQLALASNWFDWQDETFNGPIWSVSVEVLAYIFFFTVVRFSRPSIAQCLIVISASALIQCFAPGRLIVCIQFFFAGGLVQQLIARLGVGGHKTAFWSALAGVAAGVLIVALGTRLGDAVTATGLLIFATSLVAGSSLAGMVFGQYLSQFAVLGDLTYGSYLLHFPLQLIAVSLVDALGFDRSLFLSPFALLIFIVGTFALARIVHRGFEMPVQNAVRAYWTARKRRIATA